MTMLITLITGYILGTTIGYYLDYKSAKEEYYGC